MTTAKERLAIVQSKAVEVFKAFDELVALGLAGSHALSVADEYSDLDLSAFVTRVPRLEKRRQVYAQHPEIATGPLDHLTAEEFENPPCTVPAVVDWLYIDGIKCDFLWLPCTELERLLARLPLEPGQRETAAVLAEIIQPVFDPSAYIAGFKRHGPEYPAERAQKKVQDGLRYAHFFLCTWGVLQKCVARGDILAYQQAEAQMIGVLIDALYAANQVWQHDRRRVRFQAQRFRILPASLLDRLESLILRREKCTDLLACHRELLSLFHELCVVINAAHADWQLPTDWQAKVRRPAMLKRTG